MIFVGVTPILWLLAALSAPGGMSALAPTTTYGTFISAGALPSVVPTQALIGDSDEAFDPSGNPVNREVGKRLMEVGRQVAHFARLHKCEDHAQFLKEWEGAPMNDGAALKARSL